MQRGLFGLAGILVASACGHVNGNKAQRQALEGILPLHDAETIRRFSLSPEEQQRARKQERVIFTNSMRKWKVLTNILYYDGRTFQTVFYIERTDAGCYEPLYLSAFGYGRWCQDHPAYFVNLLTVEVDEERANGTRRVKPEHAMLVRMGCKEENLEAMARLTCYGAVSVFHNTEDMPGLDVYKRRLESLEERYKEDKARISDRVDRSLIDHNIVRTVVAEALAQMDANQKMRFAAFYYGSGSF